MHVSTHQLALSFGDVRALDDVTLDFPPGSRTVLWGPAGGGKTSFLKCLTGLAAPSSGEVRWNGLSVGAHSRQQKRAAQVAFGMVFQSDALFDSMTVLDNVLLPLRKRGVAEGEALDRAQWALNRVGLSRASQQHPERLSGGMKKRAGVARAIVVQPQVLIADDPFAGLDPITMQAIAELLLEVSAEKTFIIAIPDPVPALSIDRAFRFEQRVERQ